MPKLLQDGVVIMPSNQTPPLFPYNDDGYYRGTVPINQHQSPGLVVKHLEANGPYPPYANTSRNYEYTLSGHSESTKYRSCSRGSKERNLLHSSLYPHRDDYLVQNRTIRADNNYFDYTYNPRKMSYHDSPSRIKISETISSTKKFQKASETIHIRDCPNYKPQSQFNYYESRTHSEHHQFRKSKGDSLRRTKNYKDRSGFEELDYIINNAKNEAKEKSCRFKSTDHSRTRNRIARPDYNEKRPDSSLKSKSTTVLDDKPASTLTTGGNSLLTTSTVLTDPNIQSNKPTEVANLVNINTTASEPNQLPVLIPLPMPQLEMPPPPQLSFSLDNYAPYNPVNNEFNESFNVDTEKAASELDSLKNAFRSEFKQMKTDQQKAENSPHSFVEDASTVSKCDLLSMSANDSKPKSKDFIASKPPKAQLKSASQSLLDEPRSQASKSATSQPKVLNQEELTTNLKTDEKSAEMEFYESQNINSNPSEASLSYYCKPADNSQNTCLDELYGSENFTKFNSLLQPTQQSNVQTQTYASKIYSSQKSMGENLIDLNSSASTQFHTRKSLDQAANQNKELRKKTCDTPILDALAALMTNPTQQPAPMSDKQKTLDKVDATNNKYQITEYQTSLFIGKHFDARDLKVNLDINDDDPKKIVNKLTVQCFKANKNGSAKLEFSRVIILPSHADVKTLESYLDDGVLHFTCNVTGPKIDLKQSFSNSSLTSITPNQSISKQTMNSKKHAHNLMDSDLGNSAKTLPPAIFENPLYTNSVPKLEGNKVQEARKSPTASVNKPIRHSQLSTNEVIDEPMRLGKGISSNVRADLTSSSYGRIFDKSSRKASYGISNQEAELNMNGSMPLQSGRSYSLPNNASSQKSVKFDMDSNIFHVTRDSESDFNYKQRSRVSKGRSAANAPTLGSASRHNLTDSNNFDLISDGFNCITKDGLENVFLTYFFKLPSCSPSDRTQVRIENHNTLKLKIIQEKKYPESSKKSKKSSKLQDRKLKKKQSLKVQAECSSSSAFSPFSSSSADNNSLSSNEFLSNQSDHSLDSTDSFPMYKTNQSSIIFPSSTNDSSESSGDKIMLREFSRRCKLPSNVFKFDENGISVSFVNDIWVRVEIPIMEILGSGLVTPADKKSLKKKSKADKSNHQEEKKKKERKVRSALASPSSTLLKKSAFN